MRLRPEKHPRTLAIIRPDALEQFRGMTTAVVVVVVAVVVVGKSYSALFH